MHVYTGVQLFIRYISRNLVPTRAVLSYRWVDVPSFCPFCENEEESILHFFSVLL